MEGQGLFDTLTQQANQDCEQKAERARQEADSIHDGARRESARRREAALEAIDAELDAAARSARTMAEIEADKLELSLHSTLTEHALADVAAKLEHVTQSGAFPGILEALLAELLAVADTGTVLVPAAHEAHCRSWLQGNGHADRAMQVDASLTDGVAVHDDATACRITNSLSMRFAKLDDEARRICAERLFEGKGA
jgi:vacuolar-type H+-ATPase subunit E/Vma4